jgi:hypothetical protein
MDYVIKRNISAFVSYISNRPAAGTISITIVFLKVSRMYVISVVLLVRQLLYLNALSNRYQFCVFSRNFFLFNFIFGLKIKLYQDNKSLCCLWLCLVWLLENAADLVYRQSDLGNNKTMKKKERRKIQSHLTFYLIISYSKFISTLWLAPAHMHSHTRVVWKFSLKLRGVE